MPGSKENPSLDAESYRLLVSEVRDYAIFMLDPKGFILSWNEGAKRLKGWAAQEIIGKHFSNFYGEEDRRARKPERELEIAVKEGRVEDEGWRIRKDGTRFWANVVITALYDEKGIHLGFGKVTRDLTERKRMEESARAELKRMVDERTVELAQANARLEKANLDLHEADRMKDQFLAIISHELRTPLTAIYGWVSMLQRGRTDQTKLAKALTVIERNVKAQTQLVDDLLSVSRIVSGKLRIAPDWIDPVPLIEAAVDSVRPAASAKSIELVVDQANSEPIFADADRLQQVIYNLLANAIKFTPKHGQIRVEFGRIGSQFQISVSDTGEGIAPDVLPLIFNRFTQEDTSSTRRHTGMGLGLNIVRHIMELHGGTAIAHSDGKGAGATFIVRLPIPAVRGSESPAEDHSAVSLDNLKVLAVEDDPDTAEMICSALEDYGAAVIGVNSAAEALDVLKTYRPDVIVSDIGMPEMDGFEFMQKVRSQPGLDLAKVPAIALSAFAGKDHREKAFRSGYQEHISKPIAVPDLAAAIFRIAQRPRD